MYYYPNLLAEMGRKNLKQKDIADALNIKQASVSRKMNGDAPFTLEEAIFLQRFLKSEMDIPELFKEEEVS